MADTSGMADIRGIDIQKAATGYADEEFIFKNFLTVTPTSAREIRWYKKTAGVLDSTDTSGVTATQLAAVGELALPQVIEQSLTRETSYVRKYFAETPWISMEDLSDSDPDILGINIRDVTRAVVNQVDKRIYGLLSGSMALSGTAMGTASNGWGDTTNGNPIMDLLSGAKAIRQEGYDISNLAVFIHPQQYQNLLNYIISTKGSSIPAFASDKAQSGVLMKVVGQKIVVSNNATNHHAVQIVPQRVATWKSFKPISTATKVEPGIGVKFRVWEEGEILLTNPKAGHVIQGC